MLSDMGRRPMVSSSGEGSFGDELEKEIGMLLREQRREADDREKELNMYRSGSAPPTVEGSLSAVGGLFNNSSSGNNNHGHNNGLAFSEFAGGNGFMSEEELRADPAYLSYYYSNVNLNPRLPPPLLSKEDWRFTQRLQSGGGSGLGGIGDRRKANRTDVGGGGGGGGGTASGGGGGGLSMFSMPPGFNLKKQENENLEAEKVKVSAEWGGDGLIGLPGLGLGSKQKSLAEIFQDDLSRSTPPSGHPSRPASRTAFEINDETLGPNDAELAQPQHGAKGPPTSYSYAAALGASISRSTTPDPQHIARAPSPILTPIGGGRANASERRNPNSPGLFNGVSSHPKDAADLVTALSAMNLSNGVMGEESNLTQLDQNANDQSAYLLNMQRNQKNNKNNLYYDGSSANLQSHYQQIDGGGNPYMNNGTSGYSINSPQMMSGQHGNVNLPPLFETAAAAASAMAYPGMDSRFGLESPNMSRLGSQMTGNALQASYMDPMYLQYLRSTEYAAAAAQLAALNDPTMDRNNYLGNSYNELLQKAYLGTLLSPQKSQYSGVQYVGASASPHHHGYYGNPAFGVGLSYPGSPLASPLPNSPGGPGSPIRLGELNTQFSPQMRNLGGGSGVMGHWHLDGADSSFASSLLEEFKSNKTKSFELAEIAGHVVEFSADQYGSRFIQQKLETATTEDKNMVFEEIFPQALTLMTDVFGNYVIQKFFEHGMPPQRRELAGKLLGHVLTLSLQMYGCRVIQKAIEVVDMDQKIKMVGELDGHIMRCVRDQNGNHVIQKCIECVPEEHIQFIITTFFDQVVTLSTHPYGCRVIQRVLEHCEDLKTQSKVMDEILACVSMLAQDQYGNYVVQHVLEHGKPNERSIIIQELAGKIVQMSQQKFASNVVEKCLTFGDASERQLLVNEMLGTTDENEPLQAMMKDQFANYVVQKVLETCSDQEREHILGRIKVHLNALKKYTYGKHIVARVEKLVAAGERRMAAQHAA